MRRSRNRQAVVDALLDLYREGSLRPAAAEVATRAGLSPRSLFRYFDDLDDLIRTAVAAQLERARPLVQVAAAPTDPLPARIEVLTAQRAALFEEIGPAARVARREAPFQPLLQEQVARTRAGLRDQLRMLFAPELQSMAGERAATVLAAADVLCSFESYQLLRHDHGLTVDGARSALAATLATLLGGGGCGA